MERGSLTQIPRMTRRQAPGGKPGLMAQHCAWIGKRCARHDNLRIFSLTLTETAVRPSSLEPFNAVILGG